MKVNLCDCGILKNKDSNVCSVCLVTESVVGSVLPLKEFKAIVKASNKAKIKVANNRARKQ